MVLDEMLVERLDREALVTLAIKPLHRLGPVNRNPLARRLAEPAVDEPGLALLLIAPRPAPDHPLAHPEQLRRLLLIELRRFPAEEESKTSPCALPLRLPSGPSKPVQKGSDYRTGRALPKPDISSATDTRTAMSCRKSEIELSLRHEQFVPSACQVMGWPFRRFWRDDKNGRKNSPRFSPRNPLISLDPDEEIQGNPSFYNPQNLGFSQRNGTFQENPSRVNERRCVRRREGATPTPSKCTAV
jgi:hypothetical protein